MSIYTKYIQFLGVNMRKDAEELIERYGKPIVKCKDCGKEFTITASEQEFYESKELALPKRCADCRKARKMQTQDGAKIQNQEKPKQSLEEMMRSAGIC